MKENTMTQVTHYNEFGTKTSRVIISYKDNAETAMRDARRFAAQWNKDEDRENMKINFILADGKLTTV